MFGAISPRVYFCQCGWNKYVYGSPSDVLFSEKQIPPSQCGACGSEVLNSRPPSFLERLQHKSIPKSV